MTKPWPKDDATVRFDDIINPLRDAVDQLYTLKRVNKDMDVHWDGLDIGEATKATCHGPDHALSAESLKYDEEEQGRDAMRILLGIAVQLGIEQGRRIVANDPATKMDRLRMEMMERQLLQLKKA